MASAYPPPPTPFDSLYIQRPRRWLVAILALYLVSATLYAVRTPAWQAPDEPAHYNYIAYLAQERRLPTLAQGDYDSVSQARIISRRFSGQRAAVIAPFRYEMYQPPLYYLTATPFFWLGGGSLLVLRLYSVLLGAVTLWLFYRSVEVIFPDRALLTVGATTFAATLPMHVAMTAAVNNDALANLLVALALLGLLHWLRRHLWDADLAASLGANQPTDEPLRNQQRREFVWLGVVLGLGLLTKIYAYVLLAIAAATVGLVLWRRLRYPLWRAAAATLWLVGPAALLALPIWLRNLRRYPGFDPLALAFHDRVVAGQPQTLDWIAREGLGPYFDRAFTLTFRSFWGVFGWLSLPMDERVYTAVLVFSIVVLLGLLWALVRLILGPPDTGMSAFQRWMLAFFGVLILAAAASYVAYNAKFVQHQGRYFFWALLPLATFFALGWREVLQPAQGIATGGLAAVLAASILISGLYTGNLSEWNLLIIGGTALVLLAQPALLANARPPRLHSQTFHWLGRRLPPSLRRAARSAGGERTLRTLRSAVFALPFALLFVLNLINALWAIPQNLSPGA